MRQLASILATLVLLASASAGDDKPTAGSTDLQELQGEWLLQEQLNDGESVKMSKAPDGINIERNRLTKLNPSWSEGRTKYEFKLIDKSDPPAIDIEFEDEGWPQVIRGIYKLEEGRLTICISRANSKSNSKRPDAFETTQGDFRTLSTFRRKK